MSTDTGRGGENKDPGNIFSAYWEKYDKNNKLNSQASDFQTLLDADDLCFYAICLSKVVWVRYEHGVTQVWYALLLHQ